MFLLLFLSVCSYVLNYTISYVCNFFTSYNECQYVAAFEVDSTFISTNSISKLEIEESLCAVFHYEGVYGDVVRLMVYIYNFWLPHSGYEAKTMPAYAIYHKNHFLDENESFSLDFYVPILVV